MIRLIYIGDQICGRSRDFAFWDTIRDRFVAVDGDVVFSSIQNFDECAASGKIEPDLPNGIARMRSLAISDARLLERDEIE